MALAQITIDNGTVIADPELKYLNNGTAVVNLRVATNRRRKDEQTGQWENVKTHYANLVAFDAFAENIAAAFNKGDKVCATGEVETQSWEKDGQKRNKDSIAIQSISVPVQRFASDNSSTGGQSPQPAWGSAQQNLDGEPPF